MLKNLLLALSCLVLSVSGMSQVVGSGQEHSSQIYVGAEYTRLNPDYWNEPPQYTNGASLYGGYRLFVRPHAGFGVEGTWRTLINRESGDRREDSYLGSGLFLYRIYRFAPFLKGGIGLGYFTSNSSTASNTVPGQNGSHFLEAIGAGADVRVTRHLYVRPLEWEQQFWSFSPHTLSPHSFGFGAAYRFR